MNALLATAVDWLLLMSAAAMAPTTTTTITTATTASKIVCWRSRRFCSATRRSFADCLDETDVTLLALPEVAMCRIILYMNTGCITQNGQPVTDCECKQS